MGLLLEIDKYIEEKKKGSSNKELFFYEFLTGNNTDTVISKDSLFTDMDKITFSAFISKKQDVISLVKKEQGKAPLMGLHYSKNIIEILAMGLHDLPFETQNLTNYIRKCSLKEQYLISKVFPELKYNPSEPVDKIDKIVSELLKNGDCKLTASSIIDTLSPLLSLNDLYILKCAFKKLCSLHPDRKLESDLNTFISLHNNLSSHLEKKYKTRYKIIIFVSALAFTLTTSFILITYWESHGLEPIYTALALAVKLLFMLSPLFFKKTRAYLLNRFNDFVSNSVKKWYSKKLGKVKSEVDIIANNRENDKPS